MCLLSAYLIDPRPERLPRAIGEDSASRSREERERDSLGFKGFSEARGWSLRERRKRRDETGDSRRSSGGNSNSRQPLRAASSGDSG